MRDTVARMEASTTDHLRHLALRGYNPGWRTTDSGGQAWEFRSCNDLGVPYFAKVRRGRAGARLYTVPDLAYQMENRT